MTQQTIQVKPFETKVRSVGNSGGLIIPSYLLKFYGIEKGDDYEVEMVLKPKKTKDAIVAIRTADDKRPNMYASEDLQYMYAKA